MAALPISGGLRSVTADAVARPTAGAGRGPVPWRTIGAVVLAAVGAYIGFQTLRAVEKIITWLAVAAFFAVVLNPAVDFLVHQARLRRTLAAFLVFVAGLATVAGLLYLLIKPIVGEVTTFVNDFPRLVADA